MKYLLSIIILLCVSTVSYAAEKFGMPWDSYLMCVAGRDLPCNSVKYGQFRNDLVPILRAHAADMASKGRIGHYGFSKRASQIRKIIPDANPCEVVAMTSGAKTEADAAKQMFRMWRHSAGHWRCINKKARFYCYSLAKTNRGYYAIGIVIQ